MPKFQQKKHSTNEQKKNKLGKHKSTVSLSKIITSRHWLSRPSNKKKKKSLQIYNLKLIIHSHSHMYLLSINIWQIKFVWINE